MSYQKLASLILKLQRATAQNEVDWEETEKANAFQTSLTSYSIRIECRRSRKHGPGEDEYFIGIYNDAGALVEEAGDEDFSDNSMLTPMKEIFETARRKSLGVEDALDSIIEELNDKGMPF